MNFIIKNYIFNYKNIIKKYKKNNYFLKEEI